MKIGFIGQGWIGKNYADNFEYRGFNIVRYGLEPEYAGNKEKIKECDIVFLAVPTPSTPTGFDFSIVDQALNLIGQGKTAVIKSTILPGTTEELQRKHPDIIVLHSPEFLTEATAKFDAWYPDRNIVGYVDKKGAEAADKVMDVLPVASFKAIIPAKAAELIKYGGNCWFYLKIIYINMLYDLCQEMGIDYELVKRGMSYDTRIGYTHLDPIHKTGRGAGGHCFIKDFAAFRRLYGEMKKDDVWGNKFLEDLEKKNIELLKSTNKDLDLLKGVCGENI
ncbi:MAG: hypothetical protein PHT40_01160 [Patescibacteria group bacterium]|nr:hypothetical protein [Patescibacteria group bacterium]